MSGLNDRVARALECLSVCDAVGRTFEFQESPAPVEVLRVKNEGPLHITDDTQMTLFGFEAMNSILENDFVDELNASISFETAYLDWHATQTKEFVPGKKGLLQFPALFSCAAPGTTCTHSLYLLSKGNREKNDSKGCGSVMRLLPVILGVEKFGLETTIELGKISAEITHRHAENPVAVKRLLETYSKVLRGEEVSCKPALNASKLGLGWTALECVEMAIWSFCNSNTFDELLSNSICHPGDSDSVAAVAGSIWGMSGRGGFEEAFGRLIEKNVIDFVKEKYL